MTAIDLLARVRTVVATELRPRVSEIDQDGFYPADVLRSLGQAGAFAQHHAGLGAGLGAAIEAMAIVGEDCLATAFCTWCQDALGWYVANTENGALRERLQAPVSSGQVLGGTGLSNPMKALSGIETLRLRGRRVEGGWQVAGALPWVSNLRAGHPFGIAFAVEDGTARLVMAVVRLGDPGVEVRGDLRFIALDGTATVAVGFHDAFVPDTMVLADPAEAFLRRIRAGFILLQTGMALGLARGCIGLMRETGSVANAHLPEGPDHLTERTWQVETTIQDLAATPLETDIEYLRSVLKARLAAADLALDAAQAAMLHAGARGYLEGSAASRRLREAYFVAIVTPAAKHLRRDLAALEQQTR
jgi:alkylation response protein AidB-like acyl-CoA dehydrogenase